jgi:hypothetical protein
LSPLAKAPIITKGSLKLFKRLFPTPFIAIENVFHFPAPFSAASLTSSQILEVSIRFPIIGILDIPFKIPPVIPTDFSIFSRVWSSS